MNYKASIKIRDFIDLYLLMGPINKYYMDKCTYGVP